MCTHTMGEFQALAPVIRFMNRLAAAIRGLDLAGTTNKLATFK